MTPDNKKGFKCSSCLDKIIPVACGSVVVTKKPLPTPPSQRNITLRKKILVNVPTENSFESLSDDNDDIDSASFMSTPKVVLNRSCSELKLHDSYVLDEMREKIYNLTEKLDIADSEIEKLISENSSLSKKIAEYQLTIKKLTNICKTTSTKKYAKTPCKSINRTRLDFSEIEHQRIGSESNNNSFLTPTAVTPSITIQAACTKQVLDNSNTDHLNHIKEVAKKKGKNKTLLNKHEDTSSSNVYLRGKYSNNLKIYTRQFHEDYERRMSLGLNKRKLLVLADQQGKNLGLILNDLYGHFFDIFCYTCPGAHTKSVMQSQLKLNIELSKDDFVIILTGINDKNPSEMSANLYSGIQNLNNTNVFVSQIPYNRYLNETKLNSMIKFITTQFENCNFIDYNYEKWIPTNRYMFLKNVTEMFIHKVACNMYHYDFQLEKLRCNIKSTKEEKLRPQYNNVVNKNYATKNVNNKPVPSNPESGKNRKTFFRAQSI